MIDKPRLLQIIEFIEPRIKEGSVTFEPLWHRVSRKFTDDNKLLLTKSEILESIDVEKIEVTNEVRNFLRLKPTRTISGVTPVTIFTKPYTCSGQCIFCVTQENAPKSYLQNEPGIQRAIELKYNPYDQTQVRIKALHDTGHNTDKIEIIISGGTWDDYQLNYQIWYIINVFCALNNSEYFGDFDETRDYTEECVTKRLKEEQIKNETCDHRCIGMTIETRPDKITIDVLKWYRRFGVTKVQVGVQSLYDRILRQNKRGHTILQTQKALELLRINGFKIHIHWMCNLYGSDLKTDLQDFQKLFKFLYVRPDELKIYPCSIVKNTMLYRLYLEGKYKPYTSEELIELIAQCKTFVQPYTRITRLFRDIPSTEIVDGNKLTNLREYIQSYMQEHNLKCKCIRCNEIRNASLDTEELKLNIFKYNTSVSTEFFLYYVNKNEKICGFLRLSIYNKNSSNIVNVDSMIREVHVYGQAMIIGKSSSTQTQHRGLGKTLIEKAKKIAKQRRCKKLGVISAVGTRIHYRRQGFTIDPSFGYGIIDL